jgi:hypothetical protein
MYKVMFFKGTNKTLEKEFLNLNEAEDFVLNQVSDYPYEYQIYDNDEESIIDEGELDYKVDIESENLDMMFPDEESKNGFDVDDFFERE